jgi:hypothetical protein
VKRREFITLFGGAAGGASGQTAATTRTLPLFRRASLEKIDLAGRRCAPPGLRMCRAYWFALAVVLHAVFALSAAAQDDQPNRSRSFTATRLLVNMRQAKPLSLAENRWMCSRSVRSVLK